MKCDELLVYLQSCKNIDQKYVVLWIIQRTFRHKIQVGSQFHREVAMASRILGKWNASKISMCLPFVRLKMCYITRTSKNVSVESSFKFCID